MSTSAGSIGRIGGAAAALLLASGVAVAVLVPPANHAALTRPTTSVGSGRASSSAMAPAPAVAGGPAMVGGAKSANPSAPTGGLATGGAGSAMAAPGVAGSGVAGSGVTGATGTVVGPLVADQAVPADTVVRTGSVDVEVAKGHFANVFSAAADVARQVGGFVVSTEMSTQVGPIPMGVDSTVQGRGAPAIGIGPEPISPLPPVTVRSDVPSGSLVLRVPGSRFDDARRSLERLGQVRSEQLSGQDAGGQLADLDARLVDLRAAQDGLRALAAKATSTAEVLQIQAQLSSIQQQIDGLNAQLNRLHNGVALATINVRVSEPFAFVVAHPRSVLQLRVAQAGRAVESVAGGVLVVAAYLGPLAVLALVGWGLAAAARRRRLARVRVV